MMLKILIEEQQSGDSDSIKKYAQQNEVLFLSHIEENYKQVSVY